MPAAQPGQPGDPGTPRTREDAAGRAREHGTAPASAGSWKALSDAGLEGLSPPEAARVLHELGAERQQFLQLLCNLTGWPTRSALGPRLPDAGEVDALNALPGRWRVVVLPDDEAALGLGGLAFERVFVLDALWDCRQTLYGAWHGTGVDPQHVRHVGERALMLLRAGPLVRSGAAALVPDYLPRSWDPFPSSARRDSADRGERRAWSMARALTLVYWADRLDAAIAVAEPEVAASLIELLRPGDGATFSLPELPKVDEIAACRGTASRHLRSVWGQAQRARAGDSPAALASVLERLAACVQRTSTRGWVIGTGSATLPMPAAVLIRVRANRSAHEDLDHGAVRLARAPLFLVAAGVPQTAG